MNKRVDFTQLDGIDLSQDLLAFMQTGYEGLGKSMAALLGHGVVVAGCELAGSFISSGYISYNDEILPFTGGFAASYVDVEVLAGTELFGDGSTRAVSFTRQLRPVNLPTGSSLLFADLIRPGQYKNIWLKGDTKSVLCDLPYIAANFDPGTGIALPGSERAGWKIAFEMGGRVMVGWSNVTVDPVDNVWDAAYGTPSNIGGEKLHELITNELPAHNHSYNRTRTDSVGTIYETNHIKSGGDRGLYVGDAVQTGNAGGGAKHENRQPFKVYLFIEKM